MRGGMIKMLRQYIRAALAHLIIPLDTSQKDRLFKSCTTLIEENITKLSIWSV